ncbi:MAG: heme NO-binding domain-containing protein [Thermoflavifilum sp.]|nr:heme NO-binding domain-containing protein [Thermoflavifilum sp.]
MKRASDDEVVITHRSTRKMYSLAIGMAQGVAARYNEKVIITEKSCMLNGDYECVLSVKVTA